MAAASEMEPSSNISAPRGEVTSPRLLRRRGSERSLLGTDRDSQPSQPRPQRSSKSGTSTLDLDTEESNNVSRPESSAGEAETATSDRSGRRSRSNDAMRTLSTATPFRKSVSARGVLGDIVTGPVPKSTGNARPSIKRSTSWNGINEKGNSTDGTTLDGEDERLKSLETKNLLYKEEYKRIQREKKQLKKEKDAQAEAYEREIAELRREIHLSDNTNKSLRQAMAAGAGSDFKLEELREENSRLRHDLNETIERASRMVQEREQAMDELLQEIDRLKEQHQQARLLFDATLYKNKVRTETLDHKNDMYAQRVAELEATIQTMSGCTPLMRHTRLLRSKSLKNIE